MTRDNKGRIVNREKQVSNLTAHNKIKDSKLENLKTTQTNLEAKLERYEKKVGELNLEVQEQKLRIESHQEQISNTNALITDQTKEMEELKSNPPSISQEQIDDRVQDALTQHHLENFWQRKLEKTQNQLGFKNIRKTSATANLHPRQIFLDHILTPMNIDH